MPAESSTHSGVPTSQNDVRRFDKLKTGRFNLDSAFENNEIL
jgi:hypothetical protein